MGRYEPFLLSGAIPRVLGETAGAHGLRRAAGACRRGRCGAWAATFLPDRRANPVDVGSDLDFGAVAGFYASEQAGTGGRAHLSLERARKAAFASRQARRGGRW